MTSGTIIWAQWPRPPSYALVFEETEESLLKVMLTCIQWTLTEATLPHDQLLIRQQEDFVT